jgi:DUF4097 and DUF4098 domain-containing protein YvlB
VEIDVGSGNVNVFGGADGATGTITTEFAKQPPEVVHYVDGGVLHIEGECATLQLHCDIDVELTVPPGTDVSVLTGSGEVWISDTTGDVTVSAGSGDLDLDGLSGRVEADTGSGDVTLQGCAGVLVAATGSGDIQGTDLAFSEAEAVTGSGDVRLQLEAPVTRVDVETGSGEVDIEVLPGSYRLEIDTNSGDVDIHPAIIADSSAASVLSASTGSGDVRVGIP